jgi:hypothetical protein
VRRKKKPQISPLRYAPVEMTNLWQVRFRVSRKGPRNCRSLGFAPNDTGRAEDRFSAAPTALGSSSGSISQPFRAGLTFGGRPSGPCIMAIFAVSFLPQLDAGKSAARDDKGRANVPWKVVAGPKAFFITSSGPKAPRLVVLCGLACRRAAAPGSAQDSLLPPKRRGCGFCRCRAR